MKNVSGWDRKLIALFALTLTGLGWLFFASQPAHGQTPTSTPTPTCIDVEWQFFTRTSPTWSCGAYASPDFSDEDIVEFFSDIDGFPHDLEPGTGRQYLHCPGGSPAFYIYWFTNDTDALSDVTWSFGDLEDQPFSFENSRWSLPVLPNTEGTGQFCRTAVPTPTPTATATPTPTPTPLPGASCPLVPDADFETEDTWLLSGDAEIDSSSLTLGPGGIAAQNLSLTSHTAYNAAIEVVSVTEPISIEIVLGTDSEILTISEAGQYVASFTTPNLGGPLIYGLENLGVGDIEIDFVCLVIDTAGGQHDCIAPANGTFSMGSASWELYRGASVGSVAPQEALLPAPNNGLIHAADDYELPEVGENEYLLLTWDAYSVGGGAGSITAGAIAGFNDATFIFDTYASQYVYEGDISLLGGETLSLLAFANADDTLANVSLDNVCIFVSDQPAQLPHPKDPNGIDPVDFGFNVSSCDDVDGIWAGFGVNMAQYRATYAAGLSFWDPVDWVPWLVAAVFTMLGDWSCMFMAAFVTLVNVLEYALNNLLNYLNWGYRTVGPFLLWLLSWLNFWRTSIGNISSEFASFFSSWAGWFASSLGNIIVWLSSAAIDWIGWLRGVASVVMFWWGLSLFNWTDWLYLSASNLAAWLPATAIALWSWFGSSLLGLSGLRIILNILISAWNAFIETVGAVLSVIIDDWIVGLWNNGLLPVLEIFLGWILGGVVWLFASSIWDFGSLMIDLLLSLGELIITMLLWLWVNIISVGHLPLNFYYGFSDGMSASAYTLVNCADGNFWCVFLAGVQIINQTVSHSIFYPIVIVGIVLSTLVIVWNNIKELFSIDFR